VDPKGDPAEKVANAIVRAREGGNVAAKVPIYHCGGKSALFEFGQMN